MKRDALAFSRPAHLQAQEPAEDRGRARPEVRRLGKTPDCSFQGRFARPRRARRGAGPVPAFS